MTGTASKTSRASQSRKATAAAEAKATSKLSMSRRSFLKWSGVAASVPALGGLVACAPQSADQTAASAEDEGEWKPFRCFRASCHANCVSKALVKDGVVIRVKTDDRFQEETDEMPFQRGCLRGQAKRKTVYAADRLKYPMKRKNWSPENPNGHLRGKDEWVRISWDEACDIIASEIKRVRDTYGNEAILRGGIYNNGVLANYGGSRASCGADSYGGWIYPVMAMTGYSVNDGYTTAYMTNDRIDLVNNTKLIVLIGNNPSASGLGMPNKIFLDAKRNGAKIIGIGPMLNDTFATLADRWIAVRPATDTALLMGIAYYMVENNLQDQDFLDTYTVGFDADHMPEGADPRDNFKDYLLGTYDGVPKTPEWASEICGASPEAIRDLARDMATIKPGAILSCSAATRGFRGEQFAQAFLTVGWMTGNVGVPGAMVSDMQSIFYANGGKPLITLGSKGAPNIADPIADVMQLSLGVIPEGRLFGIPRQQQWDAILNGWFTDGKWGTKQCDIKLIWNTGKGDKLNQSPNVLKGIEAFKKVEFVASQNCYFTTTCQYSDVVLPMVVQWEYAPNFSCISSRDALTYCSQVIEPLFEAKEDYEVDVMIAERLGVDPAKVGITEMQTFLNQAKGAKVITEDGQGYETLFTITQDNIDEMGFPGEPQQGRMSIRDFMREGVYQVPRKLGDNYGYIGLKDFRDDPAGHPLKTDSGKLEIYCNKLVDVMERFGSYMLAPIPKYEPPQEGYESTFSDFENRVKGAYPLQFLTPHSVPRKDTQFDNEPWCKEAFPNPVYMNPVDAQARGIQQHDAVKLFNDRGAVVRYVKVSARVAPGVAYMSDGGWLRYDEELGVDFGGNANVLTSDDLCGTDVQPWNTVNIEIEKWDGPIMQDIDRPLKIVEFVEEA